FALRPVQLQGAKNITVEQLAKVRTLYEAESGSNLPAEIKRKYPHLLQNPDEAGKEPEQITTK
ncbi:hypothetical protein IID10_20895, partial [candidate division KSB1 bacterium]|nr:hypothetical protein [candidate division KSB1 bacterium]